MPPMVPLGWPLHLLQELVPELTLQQVQVQVKVLFQQVKVLLLPSPRQARLQPRIQQSAGLPGRHRPLKRGA